MKREFGADGCYFSEGAVILVSRSRSCHFLWSPLYLGKLIGLSVSSVKNQSPPIGLGGNSEVF